VRRRKAVHRSRIDCRERLLEAVYNGNLAAARRALARGASPNFRARGGTTPLYAAAVQGSAPMVRLLLEAGADPDREATGDTEGTPLCAATSWDHADAVQALLDGGADPNVQEHDALGTWGPLHWAAAKDYQRSAELLLDSGADPNLADSSGASALDIAQRAGHEHVAALLLQAASPTD
jgi:ankyrin repeat protein